MKNSHDRTVATDDGVNTCAECGIDLKDVAEPYASMGVCSDGCLGSRSRVVPHERIQLTLDAAEVLLGAIRRAYPRPSVTLGTAVNELANALTVGRL